MPRSTRSFALSQAQIDACVSVANLLSVTKSVAIGNGDQGCAHDKGRARHPQHACFDGKAEKRNAQIGVRVWPNGVCFPGRVGKGGRVGVKCFRRRVPTPPVDFQVLTHCETSPEGRDWISFANFVRAFVGSAKGTFAGDRSLTCHTRGENALRESLRLF